MTQEQIFSEIKITEYIKLSELKSNGDYFIARGYYYEILQYILSKFPRENLYIGISEEINKNKIKYYNEIYEFLGANKLNSIHEKLDTHIREYKKPISKTLEKYLYKIYKPHNENLYKILSRKIDIWENYYKNLN